jgi:uncharacterized membrane protein
MALIIISLFCVVLFYFLTPGILLSLPAGSGKKTIAAAHSVIFGLIFFFSHNLIMSIKHTDLIMTR